MSIYEDPETNSFGICILDSATSQFDLSAFSDDVCRTRLETVIRQLRPKEIVYTKVLCFTFFSRCSLIMFLNSRETCLFRLHVFLRVFYMGHVFGQVSDLAKGIDLKKPSPG